MLSWSLVFFFCSVVAAQFSFNRVCASITAPPPGWTCPDGWLCTPPPAAKAFICPPGWRCIPDVSNLCGSVEIAKILFVVFSVLFLLTLAAGLISRR